MENLENCQYKLSEEEIEENINKGLLSKNIRELRIKYDYNSGYYKKKIMNSSYLQSQGIVVYFDVCSSEGNRVYITDFFLIFCKNNNSSEYINGERVFKEPDQLTIIPLKYVEECKMQYTDSNSTYIEPKTHTKEKSPIKGAIVGSIIAGPTGAIVGAIANSGTKTVTTGGGYVERYYYQINIKIKGNKTIYTPMSVYYRYASEAQTRSNTINNQVKQMINRANIELTERTMQEVVNNTIQAGTKVFREDKAAEKFVFAIIILICFLPGLLLFLLGMRKLE